MLSTKEKWINWNEEGLLPGPDETEQSFLERAHYCLNLKQQIAQALGSAIPFQEEDLANQSFFQPIWEKTDALYGMKPSWVPLFFSNVKLAPWHGGCAWIFQLSETEPLSALLQLRKNFAYQQKYLGLYDRNELIAHELVHVGRMAYQEPQFEEFFAYQTSDSWFRRLFGPLIQSSYESLLFVFSLFFVLILQLWIPQEPFAQIAMFLPILLMAYALGRLAFRWVQFNQAKQKLFQLFQNKEKAWHVLYRLTDREIKTVGKLSPEKILAYFEERQEDSFRLKVLWLTRFSK
ncbi:hypothetical protein, putative type III secreted [Parachlamydia acanthamoebae UV-7]|jgi:hypothetical protein|uniref:Uncharacterized protein n=2 Tax=Parachlamydia acanthamoebae TaxID=83552 RepID=F8L249_PARAV|nr:hypothetical protein [Parachlamydia acanthamoebae]CCB87376.1 hypothetical protein, putative type III secreted [Parachlamydia acanthamoebae UV-7]